MSKPFGIIYKATNLINGKCYIGQTICSFSKRKALHKFMSKTKNFRKGYFCCALNHYGIDNFKWEILCDNVPIELLDIRETMKIIINHTHRSEGGYNLTWGGCGLRGYKLSNETKEKIRQANTGKKRTDESKKKMSLSHLGMIHTEETKEKMSKSRTGIVFSEEWKNNISIGAKKRGISAETRKKQWESRKKNGNVMTEETRKKISESNKRHKTIEVCG